MARAELGMIKKILAVVVVLLILFSAAVAFQPPEFKISRDVMVNGQIENTFALVNDFRNWSRWSPWEKLDPNMKRTYEGPAFGVGAKYAWSGNDQVGEGQMTITESEQPTQIRIKLEFLKPFAATNEALFSFQNAGPHTVVTWTMTGTNNFVGRAFFMLFGMQKAMENDFDKGLATIKALAEGRQP